MCIVKLSRTKTFDTIHRSHYPNTLHLPISVILNHCFIEI
nr:MAG TPA: hypothetical protein [Caudoviricetes sp.]